jgi:probable F420-dependent oxidoreductase
LAKRVESLGFEALCVADHPGSTVSPFVALGAAAAVTSAVALGTAVINTGVRHPLEIASDVATLELVSDGRALLGLGAGHTPAEWAAVGLRYPSARERIARLQAIAQAVEQLLAGETVDAQHSDFVLSQARLDFAPSRRIPVVIGGNSRSLVRAAAASADVVEIGGLGRTLPDGHFHEIRWRPDQIDQVVSVFHEAAGPRRPRLGALVQVVAVTENAESAAAAFIASAAERLPRETLPTVPELLAAPFVLIGTTSEMAQKLLDVRGRWGFTRYTVRAAAIGDIADVMHALTTTDR